MGLALVSVFLAVNAANLTSAKDQIREKLKVSHRVFMRLIDARSQQLAEGAYVLSSDFAFKRAITTYDSQTIISAMDNLGGRIGADAMALVSVDYELLADTLKPEVTGEDEFIFADLIEHAEEEGSASSIVQMEGRVYQMMVVPILAPEPIAWLCVSFVLDQRLGDEMKTLTTSDISLFRIDESGIVQIASTLPVELQAELVGVIRDKTVPIGDRSITIPLGGMEYVTYKTTFFEDGVSKVIAVLQRSLQEGLLPYYRLRALLLAISAIAMIITAIGAVATSRSVTKPVVTLVEGAREIEKGNYTHRVLVEQKDELGVLASSFNHMTESLSEKEKIRNLLGKVMSPAVAHELLNKEVTLGGEEKNMSIFFSDVKGFTSISEQLSPQDLVTLLNEYLTEMSDLIYDTDGVIDKFIGDAIVAFWGAPLPRDDHAEIAVRSALRMQRKLAEMRAVWKEQGRHEIYMRVGINTGVVVVGNMGSKERMDYTMMGDGVNLAARLEGANKNYSTELMISEFTHEKVKDQFILRELDCVRVQGKKEAIRVFEVMGETGDDLGIDERFLPCFHAALGAFRSGDFDESKTLFQKALSFRDGVDGPSTLYLNRIAELKENPPSADWDCVYDLAKG